MRFSNDLVGAFFQRRLDSRDPNTSVCPPARRSHGTGSTALTELYLSGTALTSLPAGVFEPLFHGRSEEGSKHWGSHLEESALHALGQEAIKLSAKIVLSMAKREGTAVPGRAKVHFGVD